MSGTSNIEWTNATWNPTTGCSKVSPGCAHCYAETLTKRYAGANGWPATFLPWVPANAAENVVLHPERLEDPLHWKKPRRVFVNSMSDLFHEQIPDEYIYRVFSIMAQTPQHTYQVLTKRPERMRTFCKRISYIAEGEHENAPDCAYWPNHIDDGIFRPRPVPNVWLGVTVENQHWADERIPILLDTPAAARFISAEPLLGLVDLDIYVTHRWDNLSVEPGLDWVIVGGESGPGYRPFDPAWARSIVAQCREAGVAAFVKQLGGSRPGTALEDLPEDLRVREFPS